MVENAYVKKSNDEKAIIINKGSDGFGFTVFESIQGQRVKKILYPERCENLLEGDTLLEMRTTYPHGSPSCPVGEERVTNFRGLPHHELVSILRECPVGFWAKLIVRRNSPKHRLASFFIHFLRIWRHTLCACVCLSALHINSKIAQVKKVDF
ncbi:unnamed protein product [Gongylonema pulchrum]|uniref:PDZ domain-containing protein n=1 Tax=Gongylonema pulchrum TaxID=637853 RepID=A0A3P7NEM7_9BILA|nr:unnamed protein product [Gongylonema pulchrum]